MLQATMRASGDGAEQVEVGQQRLWRRALGAKLRRRGLVGEPEDEHGVGEHELARGLRSGEVVLIEAPNLACRQAMRGNRRGQADSLVRLGARQRHEIFHRGMGHDPSLTDVLLDRRRERPHEIQAAGDPADAPIEAARERVEGQALLVMQRGATSLARTRCRSRPSAGAVAR